MFGKIKDTYVYCPGMVRSGSTTLETIFNKYTVSSRKFTVNEDIAIKNKHLPYECMSLPDRTFKIFLHRDPWSRMQSLYYWGHEISREYVHMDINKFIRKYLRKTPSGHNRYRYWDSLRWAGNIETYDIVEPFYNIPVVVERVNDIFGTNLDSSLKKHTTKKKSKQKLTQDSIDIIYDKFQKEIEYFGYTYKQE